jgi:hypothetical protein
MENDELKHSSKYDLKQLRCFHVKQQKPRRHTEVYMARLPREAVSLWKPMARSVFRDLGYQDQVIQPKKGLRTYLRNQAEYADEKHEKPQPARWDHRVNLEYDHAGMSAKWAIRSEARKNAERTLSWKSIHIAKRRKRQHEVHALAFQSLGGVCL